MLAQRAQQVIAVDNSDKMVELGSALARKQGVPALEYRKGDLEAVPIADGTVDLAFFSQSLHHALHPERAIAEAWRILKPGGRIAILDLVQHRFAEARELYADVWLGFSEVELESLLSKAGFGNVHTAVVHKETEAPFFQTVLATGNKASVKVRFLSAATDLGCPMRTFARVGFHEAAGVPQGRLKIHDAVSAQQLAVRLVH